MKLRVARAKKANQGFQLLVSIRRRNQNRISPLSSIQLKLSLIMKMIKMKASFNHLNKLKKLKKLCNKKLFNKLILKLKMT
jgi:hypothetical protein